MYSIGIDLGGTNIAVGLCDNKLNLIEKMSVPTRSERAPEEIVKDMAAVSEQLIKKNGLILTDISYIGIVVPGSVNKNIGEIEYTPNVPFKKFPLVECFKSFLPVEKVFIENDANAAALGEAIAGAGRDAKSLVMITLGTGVGGGVVIDGKIFSGCLNSHGAELGHTVIMMGGRKCGCGRAGCFEAYASATALKNLTSERINELRLSGSDSVLLDADKVTARTAFDAAKGGDAEARRLVKEFINYLAVGVTNMINIFQPEMLLIGGGISGEGDNLILPLREIVDREQYTSASDKKCEIRVAELGNDAGIIGAAALGMQPEFTIN